ncbi:hypothetical protein Tco_0206263 [Tanacetum coccineum]
MPTSAPTSFPPLFCYPPSDHREDNPVNLHRGRRAIRRDPERYDLDIRITDSWDEDYEIYTMLDDEQSQRQLLASRVNMLFRDRRGHAHTRLLMETEARMSREAWGKSMDASDLAHAEVMSLRTTVHAPRNKNKVGMRIPAWMITEEMKLMEHYKMYALVFGLDVPLIQSQPTESTQGTHRTLSTPRSPNPATETAESMPTTEKADEMILQDMLQITEEIEKLVEESENVDDSSPPRHDDTSIPGTRIKPRSDKESPEVEIIQENEKETSKDMEVEPNIVIPVNVDDEEDEITDEVFELRRRAKGKNVEESRISPIPSPTRSPRNLSTLVSLDTKKLQELTVTHPTPSSGSSVPKLTKTNRLLSLIKAKPNRFKRYKTFFHELQGR